MTVTEALDIAVQAASALAVAHRAGVVHRDIKPENIVIRPDGILKLLDFGLAKLISGADESEKLPDASTRNLTVPGMILGTVSYMSPEQAQGAKIDRRTDLWSLGVCLYEMLSGGRLPFSGKTTNHTLVSIMESDPVPLAEINRNIPAKLERIVTGLLAKEPKSRYQNADDLLADLRLLQDRLEIKFQAEESTVALYQSFAKTEFDGEGAAGGVKSIAVLPFLTPGFAEEENYLGVGVADALITQLSQIWRLEVRPTSAVKNYTDAGRDILEIGRRLGVGAVLAGGLQRAGSRLRLSVQLINTKTRATLWADKIDFGLTDFFEVQDQIAEKVSHALALSLNSTEHSRLTKRHTDSNRAFLEYLKGRYFWNKRDVEGFNRAVEHFRAAIDTDPAYALAYTGLADSYSMLPMWGEAASHDYCPRAKSAALRALEIDENLAEAHASLGYVKYIYDWDFEGAENSYRRAIELNPNYALVRAWYAKLLVVTRRFDEAREQIKKA
jgi:serine/threonine-protein kinase